MRKILTTLLITILVLVVGAWIYWQYNKKHIVQHALEKVITGKTDSLYYIHYDSSAINEVTGSASFYNISLQSDSLQQQLLQFDTASVSSIFNVHIAELSIHGANIPGLLTNQKVEANSIRLVRPVIYVIGSGLKKKREFNREDTLAIYEKIVGKFKSIKAGEIIIEDGQLHFTNKISDPFVSLEGINVNIKNVSIDSTKDYDNIISYFIKDVNAGVNNIVVKNEENNSVLSFRGFEYNAFQKTIKLHQYLQKDGRDGKIVFDIQDISVSGLSTDSFILNKQIKAAELDVKGGFLTLYKKKTKDTANDVIEIDNNFFDEAKLDKISLSGFKIAVFDKDKPGQEPFTLNNIRFNASEIQHVYSGTSIRNVIGKSNWNLSADGFSVFSSNKIYKISVGPFNIDKATGKAHAENFSVKALMPEAAFVKTLKEQQDLYNISIKNIDILGLDAGKLIAEKKLIAETVVMQPTIKVFCDRTIPPFSGSKVGNYPHQLIRKIAFPVFVKKIIAKDGYISYTERGAQTARQGTVFFSHANGTIENITNMPVYIDKNPMLELNAKAQLMGVTELSTRWKLPLNTTRGLFFISGSTGLFNASVLNELTEPLALASIKEGQIKSLDFNMEGNDDHAKGVSTLLYNNLKVEALKKDSADFKKKGLISFVANLIIKDDNPKNGNTRQGEIDLERDKTRSFFNLVWKGIFKAAKRTALGKDDEK